MIKSLLNLLFGFLVYHDCESERENQEFIQQEVNVHQAQLIIDKVLQK